MENLYANVPRDLTRVKSKVFLNLTRRQILCFGAAILLGLPLFFMIKKPLGVSAASFMMIAVMLPFFFLAMYEKNGRTAEAVLRSYIRTRFTRPKKRIYQTDNVYAAAVRAADVRKEVRRIVSVSQQKGGFRRNRRKKAGRKRTDGKGKERGGIAGKKGEKA